MRKLIPLSTLSALLLAAPAVYAQGSGQSQQEYQAPQQQTQSVEVDDATVDNFAGAFSDVQSIQQKYSQKLQQVEDENKARELQQRAQQEMIAAVEDNDLSVSEYNEVASLMNQDPELREKVMSKLE